MALVLLLPACQQAPVVPAPAGQATPTASAPPAQAVPGAPAVPPTVGTTPVPAVPAVSSDRPDFAGWVADYRRSASAAGINETILSAAFDKVRLLPAVIEADRSQPEFTRALWDYLDRAVTPTRITQGRDRLSQVRAQAGPVIDRYGVPASIVVAIWGMESNYGSNFGDIVTIDALTTLGFEGRREQWARGQLLAALRILQNGDIDRAHMIGSWAGAMGQTQFLPSNFLAYAVDADGDGRRDIWGSIPDVMASTANFLARSGWQAGQTWGAEVRLPAGFDVGRADSRVRMTSAAWAAEGVRRIDGGPLPDIADAEILLPAGARGPAFLTGPNFRAIQRYNNSISYMLGVVLLAQRLEGGLPVQASWPRDLQPLSRTQVTDLQGALNERSFDSGPPDGLVGPATRDAVRRYQRSVGLPADGFPTLDLLQRVQQK